ncbi:bifunctional metallophosphatase/5'-nucleotidase [Extensimonas sp. H3M7-6]|uniref:bifunctional metallophosphatase/5'-nucleotidase n=1 Tax=Extensimonas soli TaxID=3031322 RepID=UPI0023DA8790|nr:5'-nucleotidase C-terminal domain-containing protein [Extensimonas sp. H3M7-6]MDF1482406.1 5'-nucleotidase C-terminal domain-containing protein [Extensimonas sp. H3M7-6]
MTNKPSLPALSPFRRRAPRMLALALLCSAALGLSACGGDGGSPSYKPLSLNIAHINDHHSQLDPFAATQLQLDGVATQVELGGFARQTAFFKSLAGTPNLLKLHAGDALTGTLYYTFFKGQADAQLMNSICFDAFIPGNHEFDDGDAELKQFLDYLWDPANRPTGSSCKTPALSANIVPQAGTALAPSAGTPYLQPYLIRNIDGVDVGIIGLTTKDKTTNSSRPLPTTQFLDEASAAQQTIDTLRNKGVRHIVLMTHLGYDNDKALAAKLTDVDVIIGGDSHTLLGDFQSLGQSSAGAYPTVAKNKSGETVCIGQAWEYAKASGLMHVEFNAQGSVDKCSGQASLLIGDSFKRQDSTGAWQPLADADRQALIAKLAANPAVKVLTPDAQAAQTLATFSSQVSAEKAKAIGSASEALCLVRVPGEATNRSAGVAGCESANTLARGSDAAQVVADAFLAASKRADFAMQNAGGVRIAIPAGPLNMNTAFTLLPFTNVLVELELTGADVVAALEDGVANHLDNKQSDGSHPYASGLRWDLDMSQPKGQRFANVQVRNKTTGAWAPIDPAKTYVLVTNDYEASGKDGYTTLGKAYAAGRYVNTYLLYTQSFVDYVLAKGTLSRPQRGDYAHQKVVTKAGVTLP